MIEGGRWVEVLEKAAAANKGVEKHSSTEEDARARAAACGP